MTNHCIDHYAETLAGAIDEAISRADCDRVLLKDPRARARAKTKFSLNQKVSVKAWWTRPVGDLRTGTIIEINGIHDGIQYYTIAPNGNYGVVFKGHSRYVKETDIIG